MNADHGYNEVLANTTTALREARTEIVRLREAMAVASTRLHGLAKMGRFTNGAVDEVADYLNHEQSPQGKE